MSSKFRLRKVFKPLVILLSKLLIKLGVFPNLATSLVLFFAILSNIFLTIFDNFLLCAIFIFMTGIFDGIDGAIARLTDKTSHFGGFIDSLTDRFSEFIIFFGFLIRFNTNRLWIIIDMRLIIIISFLSSVMISYTRARGESLVKGDFDLGLMARSERLFFLFVSFLIATFIGFINELLFIFMLLVLITVFYRYFKIYKLIDKTEKNS